MKSKHKIIPVVIFLISMLIAANQAVWIHNMYNMHHQELIDYANQVADRAVLMEISERSERLGGFSVFAANIRNPSDTGRFFTKRLTTADSTYYLKIDKNDPNIMDKVTQFVIKETNPVDLIDLDSLFRIELSNRYSIKRSYFDYIDLETKKTIKSGKPDFVSTNFLSTDTIILDIQKSIAVVGYIETPNDMILQKMLFQLVLTVLLIICSIIGLFYVSRSFVSQWKLEKLRQSSINAMTHEFKRPISGAVAMVSLIPFYIKKQDFQKVSEYAGNTMTELNKLTAYTERIQQISNNDKGSTILNKESIELIPFFDTIKMRYGTKQVAGQKVFIDCNINTTQKQLNVDKLHFSNVLDNLVENAIKYTKGDVQLSIRVSDVGEKLKISVSDNGIGISAKDLPLIFDKFYRVDRKKKKNKVGFGLGLTYVKSIVEAHGGTISVESKLNEGSTFTIML